MSTHKATFASGCFWGVEANFQKTPGVISTLVGYTGGKVKNPTYQMVCSDKTGHAEVVQIAFDPDVISYEALVRTFFDLHDPTLLDRQGPNVGKQYRSAIFYHDEKQKTIAEKIKEELNSSGKYRYPIVTEIAPALEFYEAEEYHQKYYAKHNFR